MLRHAVRRPDLCRKRWILRVEHGESSGTTHISTREWDRQRRLHREVDRFGVTTVHDYDPQDNRIARTDPSGRSVFGFDRLNRLRSVQPAGESAVVLAYTPAGRLRDQVSPNGAATSQDFDPAGRVGRIRHTQSGVEVSVLDYAFDANGNRTQETQSTPGGSRSTTYSYDTDDRLIGTDTLAEDGRLTQTVNTLDGVGNRLTEVVTDAGVVTANVSYSYSPRHAVQSRSDSVDGSIISYVYDSNGSLIEQSTGTPAQTTGYRQNPQDRLATLTAPTGPPVDYSYDAEGRRVEKRSTLSARRFGYDGPRLRRETNVTNNQQTWTPTTRANLEASAFATNVDTHREQTCGNKPGHIWTPPPGQATLSNRIGARTYIRRRVGRPTHGHPCLARS